MSEPSEEPAAVQHYLICGNVNCQENGQFYCNTCHLPLCEHCNDEHGSPKAKLHDIVLYRHRKHQLPVEKCNYHPRRNIDIFCKECKIPLCSKCSTIEERHGHKCDDLEEIYTEKYTLYQGEFSKIQSYFLPTSHDLKTKITEDATVIKKVMENIRTSMKAEAGSLKNWVDEVTSENLEHTHTIEKTILGILITSHIFGKCRTSFNSTCPRQIKTTVFGNVKNPNHTSSPKMMSLNFYVE